MSDNKTKPTAASVDEFLAAVEDPVKRADCQRLCEMMESASGAPATLWGPSIVGFGLYHYRYATGREGDAPAVGFSPRAASITVYITGGLDDRGALLDRLGKHRTGKSCLYIKRLSEVDEAALRELIASSIEDASRLNVAN